MDSYVPPLLTTSIIIALLAVHFPLRYRDKNFQNLFFLCLATIWWHGSWVFLFLAESSDAATKIAKFGHVGILFLPLGLLNLFESMTGKPKRGTKYKYTLYMLGLVILFKTNFIIDGVYKYPWGYYPKAGSLHPVFLMFISLCVGYSMLMAYKAIQFFEKTFKKKQLKLAMAAGLIFSCSSYDFLLNYHIVATYPYGFVCSIVFIFLISFGAIEFDLFSTNRIITESKIKLGDLAEEVNEKNRDILSLRGEMVQKEKMASLGLLAAGVAHQLGNTLNTISTTLYAHAKTIESGNLEPEFYKKGISRMTSALKLSKDIIVSMGSVGRENDVMQTNSLSELVNSGVVLIKGKAGERVKFVNKIDHDTQVYCSKSSAVQIFMNLFSNSIDAIDSDGAQVEIYLENETDDFYEIAVADNGKGIPDAFLDKMFTPFATTKSSKDGTGLGLYIVKKEIEKNNGSLRFITSPGRTIFYITLPKTEHNKWQKSS